MTKAWEVMRALAVRVPPEASSKAVEVALTHPAWTKPGFQRKALVKAVAACVASLPEADLPALADACLPLAREEKHDIDYVEVMRLLAEVGSRGVCDVNTTLRQALFPSGESATSHYLLAIAPSFGAELQTTGTDQFASSLESAIRSQVQRVTPGQGGSQRPESPASITIGAGKEQFTAHIFGGQFALKAFVANRKLFSDQSLGNVMRAILDLIADADNPLPNREMLVESLFDLSDCMSPDTCEEAFRVLAPIALGSVGVSDLWGPLTAAQRPLNAFRVDLGSLAEFQGATGYALACIGSSHPGKFDRALPISSTSS